MEPSKIDIENLNIKLNTDHKVFIPNRSGHDFSDSLRYGQSVFITSGEVNRFSIAHIARKWATHLWKSTKEDYILLTSLTILTCVGCAIFGYLHGRLNLLIFRNGRYISRTIDLKELIESQREADENE